jgi:hypothetical protein
MQRQQMMQMSMPMGDREKLMLQQRHAEQMQSGRQDFSSRADILDRDFRRDLAERDIGARAEAATLAHGRGLEASAINRLGQLGNWRTQQAETPETIGQMRADYAGQLELGTPEHERALGITQEDPYRELPSVAEQEAMILAQFEYGSPEWMQAYQQIEQIKRAPIDPVQQMLALQRLLRGTRELGVMGAMGDVMLGQEQAAKFATQGLNALTGQPQGQLNAQQQEPVRPGTIIVNPQTQQRLEWDGRQWIPIQ